MQCVPFDSVSSGQSVQLVLPDSVWYLSEGHSSHDTEPLNVENVPGWHFVQLLLLYGKNSPAAHMRVPLLHKLLSGQTKHVV